MWPTVIIIEVPSHSVSPMFFGLMHLLLAPLHSILRVSVIYLRLRLMHWMVHLNLLSSGLSL